MIQREREVTFFLFVVCCLLFVVCCLTTLYTCRVRSQVQEASHVPRTRTGRLREREIKRQRMIENERDRDVQLDNEDESEEHLVRALFLIYVFLIQIRSGLRC